MPGNFTARALIMLNFGTNVLQSYGCYSKPLHDFIEFNLVPVKKHLHGRTFGINDGLQGELTLRK